jgi:hypothetical protein
MNLPPLTWEVKIPALRIHAFLVWIRIRRSMPLINGSGFGSGSCYFSQYAKKIVF